MTVWRDVSVMSCRSAGLDGAMLICRCQSRGPSTVVRIAYLACLTMTAGATPTGARLLSLLVVSGGCVAS